MNLVRALPVALAGLAVSLTACSREAFPGPGQEGELAAEVVQLHGELVSGAGAQSQPDLAFAAAPTKIYHVAVSGSDTNPGTAAAPFRTINHAVQVLSAGQAAYIHAGTYPEHLDVSLRDGTAAAPIALQGAPGEARPIVQGSRNTAVVRLTRAYWRVQGLEIDGHGVQGQGVRVEGGHHVLVEDCVVRDGSGPSAISIYGGAHDVGILRNRVSNFRWYVSGARRDSHGIHILPDSARVLVQENESTGNSGDGLQCTGVAEAGFGTTAPTDITIEDNRFHHNAENAVDIKSCTRVTVRGGARDSSKFYGHRAADDTGGHCAGAAIVVHYNARQILIEKNRLWDNGIGITIGRDDALASDILIRQNVIFENTTAQLGCGDGIRVAHARNVEISNNTIDRMPRSAIRVAADNIATTSETINVWNNIVRDSANTLEVWLPLAPGFASDRNLFYGSSASPSFRATGGAKSIATWRTASRQDLTSAVSDPLFPADPVAADYVLEAGSPALDIGLRLSGMSYCGPGKDLGFRESCP